MRKLTWGLAAAALCVATACSASCEENRTQTASPRLIAVQQERPASWAHICIFYDEQTKVMYMATRTGGIVPMIDAQGAPLLYMPEDE